MNKFLKTVAVFAALAMALACFVGCNNNSKGEQEKTPDSEWKTDVEGGSLAFSFYGDGTFEYKETFGKDVGEVSGTYSGARSALAYGDYTLIIKKIKGVLTYAKDLVEGGSMHISVSDESFTVEEIKGAVFKNSEQVEGPWVDVINFDDLVGTWKGAYKASEDWEESIEIDGKDYKCNIKIEIDYVWELKIIKDGQKYKLSCVVKEGCWPRGGIYTFLEPLTEDVIAKLKAAEEDGWKTADWVTEEYHKCEVTATSEKCISRVQVIKDCPSDEFYDGKYLESNDGKCYINDDTDDKCVIKINEKKNGIFIYDFLSYDDGDVIFQKQ